MKPEDAASTPLEPHATWKLALLLLPCVLASVAVWFVPPIAQDPAYHRFADGRTLLGIPNALDVLSNLPFVVVGLYGLLSRSRLYDETQRPAYMTLCLGIIMVGAGSGWYHLAPSTETLLWDRLPMAVAFMALFATVVADRVSNRLGTKMLWPALALGLLSVGYWYVTELAGRGDLRAYGLVQFLPMVLIPLLLALFPGQGLRAPWLWGTLGGYVLAKLAEHFDAAIFAATGMVSGHTLKHVFAAVAVLFAVIALQSKPPAER